MNINIKTVKDAGRLEEERLLLDVARDDDIGNYVLFDTRSGSDGGVSSRIRLAHWFQDQPVLAGDLVVLYTRSGQSHVRKNDDGTRSYFFYWGLDRPVWTERGDYAVLLQVKNWDAQLIASA